MISAGNVLDLGHGALPDGTGDRAGTGVRAAGNATTSGFPAGRAVDVRRCARRLDLFVVTAGRVHLVGSD